KFRPRLFKLFQNLFHIISLLRLPAGILCRETHAARTVSGDPRMIFGEEEDPLGDIATASNSAQGGRAVEATIDAAATMTAERPRAIAWIRLAVGTDKCPYHFHKNSNRLARELLNIVPMRPQLGSVTIVLFFSSFDIANLPSIIANGYFARRVLI